MALKKEGTKKKIPHTGNKEFLDRCDSRTNGNSCRKGNMRHAGT